MSKGKYDIDAVRDAAAGRWPEILATLGGLGSEFTTGRHGRCPKCDGGPTADRFRVFDDFRESGGLICNKCGASSDGFAAVQWLTGGTFPESLAKVADHLGIRAKGSASPEKDLEWRPWSGNLVPYFQAKRPGVTEESLLMAGAKLARYKNHTVYALPIIGETLDPSRPVGWALLEAKGGTLPKYDKGGKFVKDVKVKITFGSGYGLIGQWGLERMAIAGMAEVIWKVEGVTDLLAMQAIIPEALRDRHLVVTNSNGAGQHPKWMASALARANPYVIHDADSKGEAGAKLWAADIARHGVACKLVRLPYEVTEDHGKDLRDWISEGGTYDDLLRMAEAAQVYRPAGEGQSDGEVKAEYPIEELILSKLGLEVLYETAAGAVRVFSTRKGKSSTFEFLPKLSKVAVIQAAGKEAGAAISAEPDGATSFSMESVREALATIASDRRGKRDERGVGVWRGVKEDGSHNEAIILCNDNEGARWNGDRTLKRITTPRVDGLVLDFGDGDNRWYDFETLASYCEQADASVEWRKAVIEEAVALFGRWRWRGEFDAELVTGLVLASWIQTLWAWRPLVVITGESNSGKSTLFETLAGKQGACGIFGGLSMASAKSSEAGIRQGIGNSARVLLLDEFERSKDRDAILQTLRASSRGDTVTKGTAGHSAKSFRLQHIAWLAAIESGMSRQPDINRFVHLELLKAERGKQGRLVPPDPGDLVRLGQKLLSCAVVCGAKARSLAVELKQLAIDGADSRLVETYAVPASILGAVWGLDRPQTEKTLRELMAAVLEQDDEPIEADHELLLERLMESEIRLDHGKTMVVSRIFESFVQGGVEYATHSPSLQAHGLDFKPHPVTGANCLAVRREMAAPKLLAGTDWKGARIDQMLMRLDGAVKRPVWLNRKTTRCILVPIPAKYTEGEGSEATAVKKP